MWRVPAAALHAVFAPGAHRDVGNLMDEPLLRGWLAWAPCDSRSCCEIIGLHLDLSILHRFACRARADHFFICYILRLLMFSLMGAVYRGKGTYASRRTYRGLVKPWLVLVT